MATSTTKSKIIKSAGKKGKTKKELADSVGVGYSQVAKVVNQLAFESDPPLLFVKGQTKSGAEIFTSTTPTGVSTSGK